MVNPDLTIRPFAAADQPAARWLILTGLGEHFGHIDDALNPDLADIFASFIQPGHLFVVAWLRGERVGTGALRVYDAVQGELVRISVSAAHRRQGIGHALVAHLIAAARERGLTRLLVETNYDWYDAINLYRRFGFTEYDRDETNVYLHLALA